jgi:hypothetical protein
MSRRSLIATILVTAVVTALVTVSTTRAVVGQGTRPARTADGKPNLSGVWQVNNEANWDLQTHGARAGAVTQHGVYPYAYADVPAAPVLALGAAAIVPGSLGVVQGDGQIPYTPAAAMKKAENAANWIYTFSNAARTIHLDQVAGPPDDTWMGHSVGRWDGDTLVVDVTHFNDKTWLDRAGNFHSDALHVVERFTPMSPDALRYEVTIEDPNVFTRPWTIAMPIYRRLEPNIQLLDYPCIDFTEEFLYGHLRKQQLVKHWEGETIAVDITRKVPPGERLFEWYGK